MIPHLRSVNFRLGKSHLKTNIRSNCKSMTLRRKFLFFENTNRLLIDNYVRQFSMVFWGKNEKESFEISLS